MLAGAVNDRGGVSFPGRTAVLGECREALGSVLAWKKSFPCCLTPSPALAGALGAEGVLWADMTGAAYCAISEYPCSPPRTFLHPVGFGTLGAALPAALGTKCAFPDRRFAVLTGDEIPVHPSRLAWGSRRRSAFPVVLWNDGGFSAKSAETRTGRRPQDRRGSLESPISGPQAGAYGIPYFAPEGAPV